MSKKVDYGFIEQVETDEQFKSKVSKSHNTLVVVGVQHSFEPGCQKSPPRASSLMRDVLNKTQVCAIGV